MDILLVLDKINKSENVWKAQYMAIWNYIFYLRKEYENTSLWKEKIPFGLPASRKGNYPFIPGELVDILGSIDSELQFVHLVNLFSLFGTLLNESSKILCPNVEKNKHKNVSMEKFFDNVKILSPGQIKELKLAREARNCYIHNKNKIDTKWINSYTEVRGKILVKEGDDIKDIFPNLYQIEDWHQLIRNTSNEIEKQIKNLTNHQI